MKYEVIHPFRDKYHPEDVYYPQEMIIVEDKKRAHEILDLGVIKPAQGTRKDYRVMKSREPSEKTGEFESIENEEKKGTKIKAKKAI